MKDPLEMLEEADGEPRWLAEALKEIFQRLPPVPPAPPARAEPPSWNPSTLAILQLDTSAVPLSTKNRWHLAEWLNGLARRLMDGDEGDSKEGFTYLYTLGHAEPTSGPREKRGRV
jgi:hypothetical protein